MTEPSPGPQPQPSASSPNPGSPSGENPSFVKLAMRNMVRKGSKSLFHFGLTALGFLGFITLIAWLGRPQLPGG